ncbi:MAG: alpha/beta hydrolase [Burkholderiales bacterium]|nr:alpha/beta hydrolase [Burkholderiales bacterium]
MFNLLKPDQWGKWPCVVLVLTLGLCGCTTVPGAAIETVDGRKVEYAQSGQGTPVVVFENGLGATLDWWAKVWPDAVAEARSLAYNRAGYGHSDTSLAPRDGAQVVDELRALLQARNLPPPYVLVGHSLGGHTCNCSHANSPTRWRRSCWWTPLILISSRVLATRISGPLG